MTSSNFFQHASLFIQLSGSFIMATLWWYSARLLGGRQRDQGLYFLMLYGFTMAIQPAIDIMAGGVANLARDFLQSLLSIINSVFLVLILPNFEDAYLTKSGTNFFKKYINRRNFPAAILLIIAIIIVVVSRYFIAFFPNTQILSGAVYFLNIIDYALSTVTLLLLGIAFGQTFINRGLPLLSAIAVINILIIIVRPIIKQWVWPVDFTTHPEYRDLLNLTSLVTLSMLLIALALSWVSKSLQIKVEKAEQENEDIREEMEALMTNAGSETLVGKAITFDKGTKALILEFMVKDEPFRAAVPLISQTEGIGQLLRFFLRNKYLAGDGKYVAEQHDSNIYGGIPYKAAEKCAKILNEYSGLQLTLLQWFKRKKFGRKAGYCLRMDCSSMKIDFHVLKQIDAFREDVIKYENYENRENQESQSRKP